MRKPGDYILLQVAGKPPWPAVICEDDMASLEHPKPNAYTTLVLLIEKELSYRYAMNFEMTDYEPSIDNHHNDNQELQSAHEQVAHAMFSDLEYLDYWRWRIKNQRGLARPPTPSPPPFTVPDYSVELEACVLPRTKERSSLTRIKVNSKEISLAPARSFGESKKTRVLSKAFPIQDRNSIRAHLSPVSEKDTEGLANIGSRQHDSEKADYIDGDLSESAEMVRIRVGEGEEEQEFLVPKSEVDKRPSLSDAKIGCVSMTDDGTPRLDLPCLRDFNAEDFRFVAEFLSTGKFGYTVIDDDNRSAALAECAATWPIADRLVLEDLLDRIVVKVQQTQPWGPEEAWILAMIVYQDEGSALDAYVTMKEALSGFIADNFHAMGIQLGADFFIPMKNLPELERDVYKRLFQKAEERLGGS